MSSQGTFEQSFRARLLDLIYGQWGALGAPFAERSGVDDPTVIDPEALLWCSLEFLPTEPRLVETVIEWVGENPHYVIRQRVIKAAKRNDPRTLLWQAVDRRNRQQGFQGERSIETLLGLSSRSEVAEFVRHLRERRNDHGPRRLGRIRDGSETLLLRARDLLGQDIRHFLLVYLLANPRGGKLRDAQKWSRHAYRSFSDAVDRWKAADIVTLESGFCRLVEVEPFQELLRIKSQPVTLVSWWTVFDVSVQLLRSLAKARGKGLGDNDTVTNSLRREAATELKLASGYSETQEGSSIRRLLTGVAPEE